VCAEVVHHQHDAFCGPIDVIGEQPKEASEVDSRAVLGDLGDDATLERFDS
jgi:hypothetical protein